MIGHGQPLFVVSPAGLVQGEHAVVVGHGEQLVLVFKGAGCNEAKRGGADGKQRMRGGGGGGGDSQTKTETEPPATKRKEGGGRSSRKARKTERGEGPR